MSKGNSPVPDSNAANTPGDPISPVAFAENVLKVKLWSKQEEVLSALPQHRRVAVKSGNGLGKGFSAAVAVLWYLHNHEPAIVLSTAPTFRQVRHILWRQIHIRYRPHAQELGGGTGCESTCAVIAATLSGCFSWTRNCLRTTTFFVVRNAVSSSARIPKPRDHHATMAPSRKPRRPLQQLRHRPLP